MIQVAAAASQIATTRPAAAKNARADRSTGTSVRAESFTPCSGTNPSARCSRYRILVPGRTFAGKTPSGQAEAVRAQTRRVCALQRLRNGDAASAKPEAGVSRLFTT